MEAQQNTSTYVSGSINVIVFKVSAGNAILSSAYNLEQELNARSCSQQDLLLNMNMQITSLQGCS